MECVDTVARTPIVASGNFSIQKWNKFIIYQIPGHYKLIILAKMGHYFAHYNDQTKLIIFIFGSGCTAKRHLRKLILGIQPINPNQPHWL